jgi:hypothetical protein
MAAKKSKEETVEGNDICVTSREGADQASERAILRLRLLALLSECDDYWSGKRGKHSHVHPIFKEYWRLLQIARQLYPGNLIFEELDISEAGQPNADDIQAIEMDIRKMMAAFESDCA